MVSQGRRVRGRLLRGGDAVGPSVLKFPLWCPHTPRGWLLHRAEVFPGRLANVISGMSARRFQEGGRWGWWPSDEARLRRMSGRRPIIEGSVEQKAEEE